MQPLSTVVKFSVDRLACTIDRSSRSLVAAASGAGLSGQIDLTYLSLVYSGLRTGAHTAPDLAPYLN